MNHEIDFSADDIYIRERLSLFSVASLSQRPGRNFVLNAGELRLVLVSGEAAPSDKLSK